MRTATEETTKAPTEDLELEPVEPEDLDGSEGEDDDDGEEIGWLVVYDNGRQHIFAHPEGKTKEEVAAAFQTSCKKGHALFPLSDTAFVALGGLLSFSWSEDSYFPEIEAFDTLQQRVEGLIQAVEILATQQAGLQEAQAGLFQAELEDLQDEAAEAAAALTPPVLPGGKRKRYTPTPPA
jgi:hypothetical protein